MLRLAPPDCGIDILDQHTREAFQCKAVEMGAAGTLSVKPSIESLSTAINHRAGIPWSKYLFATNGRYSGVAQTEIVKQAALLGLTPETVQFLGPEFWVECCGRHFAQIKDRLHYRVTVEEIEVIEALKKARYFPQIITRYSDMIDRANYKIIITNNRTPLELEIPFSPEMSVENCVDVAKEMLGISLEWTSFDDLNTSAGPSLSLTVNGHTQGFSKKLAELGINSGDKVQLWIKIVWRDGLEDATPPPADVVFRYSELIASRTRATPVADRGKQTVSRKEEIIQSMMWQSIARFAGTNVTGQ